MHFRQAALLPRGMPSPHVYLGGLRRLATLASMMARKSAAPDSIQLPGRCQNPRRMVGHARWSYVPDNGGETRAPLIAYHTSAYLTRETTINSFSGVLKTPGLPPAQTQTKSILQKPPDIIIHRESSNSCGPLENIIKRQGAC